MANTPEISISARMPINTAAAVQRLAETYGISKAAMLIKLIEHALIDYDEPIEVSANTQHGARHKNGVAKRVNTVRELL